MTKIGIDLVYIPEFQKRLEQGGGVEKVFTNTELVQNPRLENLAGVFAAKEAFMKALGKKIDWREVWIEKTSDGRPQIFSTALAAGQKADISISHDRDYAIAIASVDI